MPLILKYRIIVILKNILSVQDCNLFKKNVIKRIKKKIELNSFKLFMVHKLFLFKVEVKITFIF